MLKILQIRLQQYVNHGIPHVQAGFRKGRGIRDQIANIHWITKKAREFQKNIYFCFIDYAKAFDCVQHNNLWKFFKNWEYQTTWSASWEICIQVRKQQLQLDMEQQTSSKLGKEHNKAIYCHPACLTYIQSAGWSTSWNQDFQEKYQKPQICRWHHTYGRKQRRTKEPLDESERGEWESRLKALHSKNKGHDIWSHHFMANRWGNNGNSEKLYFGGTPTSLQMVIAALN